MHFPGWFEPAPLASVGGEPLSVCIDVMPYLQLDPTWRAEKMGNSNGSLGRYGCTVCATAMALTSQGNPINPSELNRVLTEQGGFTASGLLIWASIKEASEDRFGIRIVDRCSHAYLDNQLKAGNPLIAKVLYENRIWHWVLITGKEGDRYLMHDPLGIGVKHEVMEEEFPQIYAIRHLVKL